MLAEDWVSDADVRLREEGHVFHCEAFVVPATEERLVERAGELTKRIEGLEWKLHDVVVVPVSSVAGSEEESTPARHRTSG